MTLLLFLRPRGGVQSFPEPPDDRTFRSTIRQSVLPAQARPDTYKAPALPKDRDV